MLNYIDPQIIKAWNFKKSLPSSDLSGFTPFIDLIAIYKDEDENETITLDSIKKLNDREGRRIGDTRFSSFADRLQTYSLDGDSSGILGTRIITEDTGAADKGSRVPIRKGDIKGMPLTSTRYKSILANNMMNGSVNVDAMSVDSLDVTRSTEESFTVTFSMKIFIKNPALIQNVVEFNSLITLNSPFILSYGWIVPEWLGKRPEVGETQYTFGLQQQNPPPLHSKNAIKYNMTSIRPNSYFSNFVVRLWKYDFSFNESGSLEATLDFMSPYANALVMIRAIDFSSTMMKFLDKPRRVPGFRLSTRKLDILSTGDSGQPDGGLVIEKDGDISYIDIGTTIEEVKRLKGEPPTRGILEELIQEEPFTVDAEVRTSNDDPLHDVYPGYLTVVDPKAKKTKYHTSIWNHKYFVLKYNADNSQGFELPDYTFKFDSQLNVKKYSTENNINKPLNPLTYGRIVSIEPAKNSTETVYFVSLRWIMRALNAALKIHNFNSFDFQYEEIEKDNLYNVQQLVSTFYLADEKMAELRKATTSVILEGTQKLSDGTSRFGEVTTIGKIVEAATVLDQVAWLDQERSNDGFQKYAVTNPGDFLFSYDDVKSLFSGEDNSLTMIDLIRNITQSSAFKGLEIMVSTIDGTTIVFSLASYKRLGLVIDVKKSADHIGHLENKREEGIFTISYGSAGSLCNNISFESNIDPNAWETYRLPAYTGSNMFDLFQQMIDLKIITNIDSAKNEILKLLKTSSTETTDIASNTAIETVFNESSKDIKLNNINALYEKVLSNSLLPSAPAPGAAKKLESALEKYLLKDMKKFVILNALSSAKASSSLFGTMMGYYLKRTNISIHGTCGLNTHNYIRVRGLIEGVSGIYSIVGITDKIDQTGFSTELEAMLIKPEAQNKSVLGVFDA